MHVKQISFNDTVIPQTGGGRPVPGRIFRRIVAGLSLVAWFAMSTGCRGFFDNEVVNEGNYDTGSTEVPGESTGDMLNPYGESGDLTAVAAANRNDAVDVTVFDSPPVKGGDDRYSPRAGLKIDLEKFYEFYKNNNNGSLPRNIVLKITGLRVGVALTDFVLGLLDANNAKASNPEKKESIFVDLSEMEYANPILQDWRDLSVYGIKVDQTEGTIELDLQQRPVLTSLITLSDPGDAPNYITLKNLEDNAVDFAVQGAGQNWAYLGLNMENAPYTYNAGHELTLNLSAGAGAQDLRYRVTLGQAATRDADGRIIKQGPELVYYPEEHPDRAPGAAIPLRDFHEAGFTLSGGAAAELAEDGGLNLGLRGADSQVTINVASDDPGAKIALDLRKDNFQAWNNGLLKFKLAKPAGLTLREFLAAVKFGFSCLDSRGAYQSYTVSAGDDAALLDSIAAQSVEDADFWEVRVPLNLMSGRPEDGLALSSLFFGSAAAGPGDYKLLSATFSDGGAEQAIPLPDRVNRGTDFDKIGFVFNNGQDLPELRLADVYLGGRQLDFRGQVSRLNSEVRAVSLGLFLTNPNRDDAEAIKYTVETSTRTEDGSLTPASILDVWVAP
ncbi:MAG: hypothetical protein LBQ83_00815 [Candidatus Margulisbacteria bacterium]|jgi:hypothetical protein|nr:hypothetical protein [Candidatus Margulisiibacteriota bacterium]